MVGHAEQARQPAVYEVRVRGTLTRDLWPIWFEGMEIRPGKDGDTLLVGVVADQSALYGLIARLRDLALILISVQRIENDSP
ncbi:MAG TPA: hypothetical protein VMT34_07100 [Aggregatilineales bacterium]|nr:hypothetical protein [Aggregatilineales bacterium]